METSPLPTPIKKPITDHDDNLSNDMHQDTNAIGERNNLSTTNHSIFRSGNNAQSFFLNSQLTVEQSLVQDLLLVALFVILYAALTATDNMPVYHRRFYLDDETISFPRHRESVTDGTLYVVGFIAPFVLVAVTSVALRLPRKWMWLLCGAYLRTHIFNLFSTFLLKCLVGRPRPEFLKWSCQPNIALCVGNMCTTAACQANQSNIYDGHQSFPSAHASISFAGLSFLSLFIWGLTKPHLTGHLLPVLAAFCPLLTAAYVSLSRVQDYRHHWEDIVIGSILGTFWAVFFLGLAYLRPPSRY